MRDAKGECFSCDYKRGMANPQHGVKIPGVGKCIRPGGHCPEYLNSQRGEKQMAAEAEVIDIGRGAGEAQANTQALEKELKEFSGGLPYDQARIIERTQDGFRQGVHGFYLAGLGLLLIERNEDVQTFGQVLEQYFPGISRSAAYSYMRFARAASILPNFKQFCLASGGYSKGLTMLESCSGEEMAEFESTGELRGYTQDQVDRMSVRQLKQALRRAKEKAEAAVHKATEKLSQENAALKEKNELLEVEAGSQDLAAAKKVFDGMARRLDEAAKLLRKLDILVLAEDWGARIQALAYLHQIRLVTDHAESSIFAIEDPGPEAGGKGDE